MDRQPRIACWLLLALAFSPLATRAADPPQAVKESQLTGCLDEDEDSQYVLRGDKDLQLLARLEPDGFAVQSFAKYLGHKITVTGRVATDSGKSVMKVKKIQDVAKTCEPDPQRR